ncbi:unnamed protein product [Calypogeia fissa]
MDNDVHDMITHDLLSDLDGDEVLDQNAAEGILPEPPAAIAGFADSDFVDPFAATYGGHGHCEGIGRGHFPTARQLDEATNFMNHIFLSWLDFLWPYDRNMENLRVLEKVSPLHVAAYGGMGNYCHHLIQLGHNPNTLDETIAEFMNYVPASDLSRTLGWAAEANKVDAVIALLKSPDISVDNMENEGCNTPL